MPTRQAVLFCAFCVPLLASPAKRATVQSQQVPQDAAPSPPVPIVLPPPKPKPPRPKPASTDTSETPAAATDTEKAKQQPVPEHRKPTPVELPTVPMSRAVVVLDASHGGVDSGSRISDAVQEKDVTLALAFKLRSLLAARGFTVVMTRDSDEAAEANSPGTPLTLDDRAGIANHAHAVACLLLHATGSGSGAHLYSSELTATPGQPSLSPWLTAQSAWVSQSQALESRLGAALTRAQVPLVMSAASVRPVDSLTCPALVVELAPEGDEAASVNDDGYQGRVAQAIAGALVFWQNEAVAPIRLQTPAAGSDAQARAGGGKAQP